MQHKERPPTRVMPQIWQSSHGHASGAFTSQTGLGKPQTTRKSRNCRSAPWTDTRVSPQWFADLLNDVERTLTWLAQTTNSHLLLGSQDTDWRATHRTHAIHRARVGTCAQARAGSMNDFSDSAPWLGVERPISRNGSMATLGDGRRAGRQTRHGQCHGATGHDNVL